MSCTEPRWRLYSTLGAAALAACGAPPAPPVAPPGPGARPPLATPAPAPPAGLAAPVTPSNWAHLQRQAAQRMVQANPGKTYLSDPPEVLLAIPVLEIELNGDGSIRRIVVVREPRQAKDTTQLAIDAVRRAAPFGDVSRLPRPWKFTETFLFDDERRFKPRSLN